MDSDQGKLFIGGISWETTEDKLREYFGKYGEVMQAVIMRDKISGRPRGFGFIVFSDPALVDRVLQDKHTIDGRVVEAKRAMSREEQNMSSRSGNPTSGRSMGGSGGGGGGQKTKKIFVGGLPPTLSEEGFRKYFEAYGTVTDVVVMYDQNTQRPRGFGFISFDSEDAVDRVLHKTFHDLGGKLVEVKRAMPKDSLTHGGGGGRPMGGGGGGYQQYGGPIPGSGGYEGRMDGNRYMPPQSGGGFPPYGSSGYGAHSYGYGAGSNGVGYGGYGVGGYGGPAGGYGNPNAPAGGYPSGPRSPWSNQQPSGYGSGYGGNAGYGSGSGQSPSGSGGYGNQGYGYGGYGGGGEYISRGGGGGGGSGGGGDQHGPGSGYMEGGYGDAGGGYPSSWKSDPSQGAGYGPGQSGYGSYGGGPARQAQQQ